MKETKEITLPPRLELGTSRLTVERASQLRHGRDVVCVSELMGFDGSTAEGVGIWSLGCESYAVIEDWFTIF